MKEDIEKIFEKLENESDRGVALISEVLINNYLTSLFEKYLILNKDLRGYIFKNPLAPLNTFSNKIKMAYSLGLIDEDQYKNLECVRKIRNEFAHNISNASFKNAKIIELCKQIKIPRIPGDDPNNYRYLFYDVAHFLAGYLYSRTLSIKKQKYI